VNRRKSDANVCKVKKHHEKELAMRKYLTQYNKSIAFH